MSKLVILEDEDQLRELAFLVYRQEANAIYAIRFKSENERTKYLNDCLSGYNNVLGILDSASKTYDQFKDDETKGSIAHDMYSYAVKCVNTSLQTVSNYYLRLDYLYKIKNHADMLMQAVEELDPQNVTNVQRLAKEATQYKECMDRFLHKYQSGLSKTFADKIKNEGLKFPDLVKRCYLACTQPVW